MFSPIPWASNKVKVEKKTKTTRTEVWVIKNNRVFSVGIGNNGNMLFSLSRSKEYPKNKVQTFINPTCSLQYK